MPVPMPTADPKRRRRTPNADAERRTPTPNAERRTPTPNADARVGVSAGGDQYIA